MDEEKEKLQQQKNKKASNDEDEEDDFNDITGGESLLSLVQPQMVTLSRHWLSALKDHALLCLPPGEFVLNVTEFR